MNYKIDTKLFKKYDINGGNLFWAKIILFADSVILGFNYLVDMSFSSLPYLLIFTLPFIVYHLCMFYMNYFRIKKIARIGKEIETEIKYVFPVMNNFLDQLFINIIANSKHSPEWKEVEMGSTHKYEIVFNNRTLKSETKLQKKMIKEKVTVVFDPDNPKDSFIKKYYIYDPKARFEVDAPKRVYKKMSFEK